MWDHTQMFFHIFSRMYTNEWRYDHELNASGKFREYKDIDRMLMMIVVSLNCNEEAPPRCANGTEIR